MDNFAAFTPVTYPKIYWNQLLVGRAGKKPFPIHNMSRYQKKNPLCSMKKKKNKTLRSFSCGFQVFFMEECALPRVHLVSESSRAKLRTEVYSFLMQISVEKNRLFYNPKTCYLKSHLFRIQETLQVSQNQLLISMGVILPSSPRPLAAIRKTTDRLMAHEADGYFCLHIHSPDVDTQYLESCPNMYSEVNLNADLTLTSSCGKNFSICLSSVYKNDERSEGQSLKGI